MNHSNHQHQNHPQWDQYHQSTPKILLPPAAFEKTAAGLSITDTIGENDDNPTETSPNSLNMTLNHPPENRGESLTSLGFIHGIPHSTASSRLPAAPPNTSRRPAAVDYYLYGLGTPKDEMHRLFDEIDALREEVKKMNSENEELRLRNKSKLIIFQIK